MKKCWMLLILMGLLTGCGAEETLETIADVPVQPVSASIQQVLLDLPEDMAAPVLENPEGGQLYVCDGYTLSLQTMASGDLEKSLQTATGFSKKDLQIMETLQGDSKRYESVWAAAGEPEMQVGRVCILDDGNYHYVLTAMTDAKQAGALQETLNTLFSSFRLTNSTVDFNTGS